MLDGLRPLRASEVLWQAGFPCFPSAQPSALSSSKPWAWPAKTGVLISPVQGRATVSLRQPDSLSRERLQSSLSIRLLWGRVSRPPGGPSVEGWVMYTLHLLSQRLESGVFQDYWFLKVSRRLWYIYHMFCSISGGVWDSTL